MSRVREGKNPEWSGHLKFPRCLDPDMMSGQALHQKIIKLSGSLMEGFSWTLKAIEVRLFFKIHLWSNFLEFMVETFVGSWSWSGSKSIESIAGI